MGKMLINSNSFQILLDNTNISYKPSDLNIVMTHATINDVLINHKQINFDTTQNVHTNNIVSSKAKFIDEINLTASYGYCICFNDSVVYYNEFEFLGGTYELVSYIMNHNYCGRDFSFSFETSITNGDWNTSNTDSFYVEINTYLEVDSLTRSYNDINLKCIRNGLGLELDSDEPIYYGDLYL